MQTMNISLPDQLRDYVDDQISSGRYSSASEYIRELIRIDEKQRARERLEALLLEGIQSGDPSAMTPEDWAEIRREAVKQFQQRRSDRSA